MNHKSKYGNLEREKEREIENNERERILPM